METSPYENKIWYFDPSFTTIRNAGAHNSVVHPPKSKVKLWFDQNIFIVDTIAAPIDKAIKSHQLEFTQYSTM